MKQPKIYSKESHGIDRSQIDADALFVVQKLKEAGHTAYLVGGSVRDLLIKRRPKDFDISTSAEPEEIKQLFRRQCLLIGRRFRLAHIRFQHKIIEVSTFRSGDPEEDDLIIRDNNWGSPEDDVMRRDFTINGLFYDPTDDSVIDYVDGCQDVKNNILRTIGNPDVRFKQDPVRMIRLLKFRARLKFNIDEETKNALIKNRMEIVKSSPARILEEMLRMLESGASAPFFHLMNASGILKPIFPTLARFLEKEEGKIIFSYLGTADKINENAPENPLDRTIMTACLLFPMLQQLIYAKQQATGQPPHISDIMMISAELIKKVVMSSFSRFPKRISAIAEYILTMQYRFTPLSGRVHHKPKMYDHKEFILALKFLKIRALVDESLAADYNSWKEHYKEHYKESDRRHHPQATAHKKRRFTRKRASR